MNKKVFLSIVFLIGCISIAILPRLIDLYSLNTEFAQLNFFISKIPQSIKEADTFNDYLGAVESYITTQKRIKSLYKKYNSLKKQKYNNYFLNLWSNINDEKINSLEIKLKQTNKLLYNQTENILNKAFKHYKMLVLNSNNINQLKETLRIVKQDTGDSVMLLTKMCKLLNDKSCIKYKLKTINFIKYGLNNLSELIIRRTDFLRLKIKNSIFNEIKMCKSVKCVVDVIKIKLRTLYDIKTIFNDIAGLKPPRKLFNKTLKVVNHDITETANYLNFVKRVIASQNRANDLLKKALKQMDYANSRLHALERYAPASVIASVYKDWQYALMMLEKAKNQLKAPSRISSIQRIVWVNCNKKAKSNIEIIREKAFAHLRLVKEKLIEAVREESSVKGRMTREIKRFMDRFTRWSREKINQFGKTRIAKELGIPIKLLILGTKAFYDLQDPNKDMLAWSMGVHKDIEKLKKEIEEIQKMDEPSITGKNTFIEDLVRKAYEINFSTK